MSLTLGSLTKTITFRRMSPKAVIKYEVYARYKDSTYESGLRTELLDTITNPDIPTPVLKRIELEYNVDATWELPHDAYLDRDHQFRLYLNGFVLSAICFNFNRLKKLISLDTVMKKYESTDKIELEYYQDLITKTYSLMENCDIYVKPVFSQSYAYGYHNIII